ncbi:MAG: NAD(P)-dependent oxidoreductase [Negativicutes bacterium]|nr:NAD(P)-dependent oxidoreductase [Negativicutes bacterium]
MIHEQTPKPQNNPVGMIGLGIMGSAMAANLIKSGFAVIGTDVLAKGRDELASAGGTAVAGASEIGRRCRHIILALPSEAALREVCADLAASCAPGAIVMETGTLPLTAKQEMRELLAGKGVILLDCTLSGTGAQARNRDLAVYASGDEAAIEEMAPIIDGFARVCYRLGEFGNGMKMKLVANLLVAIHNVAAAEAVLLGARSGLDPATVVKVVADGAGGSRMLQVRGPAMVNRTWDEATMKHSIWQKDMRLIGEALEKSGSPAPLFAASIPIYNAAMASGHADHDTAAVYEVLERMTRQFPDRD